MEDLNFSESIGGYFELETPVLPKFREGTCMFNSGRSALAFLLEEQNINKVYLPYYTCDVVLEPIKALKIDFEFYTINAQLLPEIEFKKISSNSAIVVNNYFGLLDTQIKGLTFIKNVIVDNSQAFYSNISGGIGSFNSFRKFFGLADGAEAFVNKRETEKKSINDYPRFTSHDKMAHLLGRIESGAEMFYHNFKKNDDSLKFTEIKRVSKISEKLYTSIDHKSISKTRIQNFNTLHKRLQHVNKLDIKIESNTIPLIYPLWVNNGSQLRSHLIENQIYIACYWPNKEIVLENSSLEMELTKNLVALPIDQRYGIDEMEHILNLTSSYVK